MVWAVGLWLLLPTLSVLAYLFAWVWRDHPFSTRDTPATVIRIAVGVAFAGWVHPALGGLAALSALWWLVHGYPRIRGGLLWPTIAMMWWLAGEAPSSLLAAAVVGLLVVGLFQTAVATLQWRGWPIFPFPGYPVHGTIGHRTGLGIFLAVVTPLGFLTDYGWVLAAIYAVGIALSQSTVATGAFAAGMLIAAPGAWWIVPFMPVLALGRLVERHNPGTDLSRQWHVGRWCLKPIFWSPPGRPRDDTWALRTGIWRSTWRRARAWPFWLIGHGAGSFRDDAPTWTSGDGLREAYQEAHCDYVELFYEYGVIGMAFLGWLVVGLLGPTLGWTPATGALAALAVAMVANFPMSVSPIITAAFVAMAWTVR